MRLLLISLFLSVFAIHVRAECYVVGDLKGYSVREGHQFMDAEPFEISQDGLTGQKFMVELDGDNSSVTPSSLGCTQMGNETLICLDVSDSGQTTIETWSVFPEAGKAQHTKSITGYGPLSGGNLFIGSVLGSC